MCIDLIRCHRARVAEVLGLVLVCEVEQIRPFLRRHRGTQTPWLTRMHACRLPVDWNAREEVNGRAEKIWERADETDPGTTCEDTSSRPHATTTPSDPSQPRRATTTHVTTQVEILSPPIALYSIQNL